MLKVAHEAAADIRPSQVYREKAADALSAIPPADEGDDPVVGHTLTAFCFSNFH
jgi:hypothetical protein